MGKRAGVVGVREYWWVGVVPCAPTEKCPQKDNKSFVTYVRRPISQKRETNECFSAVSVQ